MKMIVSGAIMALAIIGVKQVNAAPINHDAATHGDLARVEQQLNSGVDVNHASNYGDTALTLADAWSYGDCTTVN